MRFFECLCIFLSVLACSSDDTTEPADMDPRTDFVRFINPTDTDPSISTINNNEHYVLFKETNTPKNKLVIFLGGTFSRTTGTSVFTEFAADQGFHVINLAYPNLVPVSQCSDSMDPDCALNYRTEILYGTPISDLVSVSTTDAIQNRILKLLQYLTDADPQGNWQQYMNNNDIVWNKIIVGGHSQGSGHAAFIANQKQVSRALMFAGPNDFSSFFNQAANWLSSSSQTPLENYYSFLHLSDEITPFSLQEQCNLALGFTSIFNIDNQSSPYQMQNALFTDTEPSNFGGFGGPYHGSVVTDTYTPFVNGVPQHQEVWLYMLGE